MRKMKNAARTDNLQAFHATNKHTERKKTTPTHVRDLSYNWYLYCVHTPASQHEYTTCTPAGSHGCACRELGRRELLIHEREREQLEIQNGTRVRLIVGVQGRRCSWREHTLLFRRNDSCMYTKYIYRVFPCLLIPHTAVRRWSGLDGHITSESSHSIRRIFRLFQTYSKGR